MNRIVTGSQLSEGYRELVGGVVHRREYKLVRWIDDNRAEVIDPQEEADRAKPAIKAPLVWESTDDGRLRAFDGENVFIINSQVVTARGDGVYYLYPQGIPFMSVEAAKAAAEAYR